MTDTANTLAQALLAAQKDMPAVDRDGTNPHFGSRFTTLDNLISKVRPVLNKHGLSLMQMPSQDERGNPVLITRLLHEGGESIEATMPLLTTKSDPQALGSALTYAKRYALAAALAIADQEDDDGNAGSTNGGGKDASPRQRPTSDPAGYQDGFGVDGPPEHVGRITAAFGALKLKPSDINLLFGSLGIDGAKDNSRKAIAERLESLPPEQVDVLESELNRMGEEGNGGE